MKIIALILVALLVVVSPALAHGPGKGHDGHKGEGNGHDKDPKGPKDGPKDGPKGPKEPDKPGPDKPGPDKPGPSGSGPSAGREVGANEDDATGTFALFNLATGRPFAVDGEPAIYYSARDCLRAARMLNARFPRPLWKCYRVGL